MEVADDLFCRAPCGRRYVVLRHRRLERCRFAMVQLRVFLDGLLLESAKVA
jgi:hypothetical protein